MFRCDIFVSRIVWVDGGDVLIRQPVLVVGVPDVGPSLSRDGIPFRLSLLKFSYNDNNNNNINALQ